MRISDWSSDVCSSDLSDSLPLTAANLCNRAFSMPAFPDAERDSHMGLAGWARKVTGKPTMTVGGVGFSKDLQSSFVEETNAINNLPEVVERFEREDRKSTRLNSSH